MPPDSRLASTHRDALEWSGEVVVAMSEKSWWNTHLERKQGTGLVALTIEAEELSHCHILSVSGKLTVDSSPELLDKIRGSAKA
jgi:hypothetical protein